jgi:signal transduction histidine kinase
MTSRKLIRPGLMAVSEWPTLVKATAIMIVITLVASLLVMLIVSQISRQALLTEEMENMEQTTQLEATRLTATIDRKIAALNRDAVLLASQNALTDNGDPVKSDITRSLDAFRNQSEGFEAILLVSDDGSLLVMSPALPAGSSFDASKLVWFDETGKNVFIAGPSEETWLTGMDGIHIAVPVTDTASGETIGALYAVYDPDLFFNSRESEHAEGSQQAEGPLSVNVYSADGKPFFGSLYAPAPLPTEVQKQVNSSASGSIIVSSGMQLPQVYAYTHLSSLGVEDSPASDLEWIITTQRGYLPMQEQLAAQGRILSEIIGAAALAICAGFALTGYILYRPTATLLESAEQIIASDDTEVSILSQVAAYDLKTLSAALQTLLGRLRYRATQLDAAAAVSRESVTYDIHTLLDRLVGVIREHLAFPAVYLYQVEPDGMRAHIEVGYGTSDNLTLRPGTSIILSEQNIVGRALLKNETQWYKGLRASFRGKSDEPAEVVVPLRGAISSALHIVGSGPDAFSQTDVNIFELIANEIAAILDNHMLIEQAQKAREEAERANQIKSQFLAAMSHELRTPLNSIINFSMFVAQGAVGTINEKQEELLRMVIDSSEHLLSLINDVLDISKIESGLLDLLVDQDVDLNRILSGVITTGRGLLGDKPVELVLDISDLPPIVADQRRVRQIILNIVSNACKFTAEGSITIRAWQENEEIKIMVKDTGPGIAAEDHEVVFETFRQTEVGLAHGTGTGLGMPISRRLAEAHGGRLWVESESGTGATFYIVLPVHSEELARRAYKKSE